MLGTHKRDLFLVLALLLTAAILLLLLYPRSDGFFAEVLVDGKVIATYPLSTSQTVTIQGVGGTNLLSIADGCASITEADCPDRLCARTPSISHVGEQITCLPHRVIVRITGAQAKADTVVRLQREQEVWS